MLAGAGSVAVRSLLDPDARVWTTRRALREAKLEAILWGFVYVTLGFVAGLSTGLWALQ